MAEFSDYYEDAIIDHMLSGGIFTPPANIYLALFTAVTGLEANNPTSEVSGTDYARVEVTLDTASGGATANALDVTFPVAGAGGWGSVTHVAIVDHATNTTWGTNVNVLMWTELDAPKTIDAGDTAQFNDGDLDITID
jgi:hypothetical protein